MTEHDRIKKTRRKTTMGKKQAGVAACEECHGHGYHARHVAGFITPRPEGFRGIEIERCDICGSCKTDDHASLKFTSGLECHDAHALQELAKILDKPSLSIVLRAILDREGYAGS